MLSCCRVSRRTKADGLLITDVLWRQFCTSPAPDLLGETYPKSWVTGTRYMSGLRAWKSTESGIAWQKVDTALEQLFMDAVIVLHQRGSDLYDLLWRQFIFKIILINQWSILFLPDK